MIELRQLVKKFGERTAVDRLDLQIAAGEVFGLLGPNGAGKTTIIRMLTMLTRPTSGEIRIGDCTLPVDAERVKAMLGIVPQHFNLDVDLTVGENLDLHGRLHHIGAVERKQRIDELLEYVELQERIGDKVQNLSGGMKRRLMIARALFHRPRILFLDEPTVGLDPQVRRKLWDLIRRLQGENFTVLLTTHYIEEAEALCNRVAILDKGRLIALDSPEELRRRTGAYVVEWMEEEGSCSRFFHERSAAGDFAGTLAVTATIRRSNLEDVFVELTGRKVSE
jgi:ABC-2 type transport system ATP-binding protein